MMRRRAGEEGERLVLYTLLIKSSEDTSLRIIIILIHVLLCCGVLRHMS